MPAFIAAGGAVLGGLLGGSSARKAAQTSANAQIKAAQIAADAQRFRPVGVTSRFGSADFQTDAQGNLTRAGYNVAPDVAAAREQLLSQSFGQGMGFGAQGLQQGQSLFNLGQQFIPTSTDYSASPQAGAYSDFLRQQAAMAAPTGFAATPTAEAQAYASRLGGLAEGVLPSSFDTNASPEAQALYRRLSGASEQLMPQSFDTQAAAQQYMQQQQALLQPSRDQARAGLTQNLFNTGRGGVAVAQGGNMGAANPEQQAYYNAIAQQDAQLAANAQQQARSNLAQDIGLSSSLGTSAVNQLGTAQQQALSNSLARTQAGANLFGTSYGANLQSGQQQLENSLRLGSFAAGQAGTALSAQQQAEELARQRMLSNIQTGTGLFSTGIQVANAGYSPFQTQFGLASTLEQSGQNALDLGAQLGGRAAQAGANVGQSLLTGGTNAARTMQPANAFNPYADAISGLSRNPQFAQGLSNLFNPSSAIGYGSAGTAAGNSMVWDGSGFTPVI
jgi:hypothetical protein